MASIFTPERFTNLRRTVGDGLDAASTLSTSSSRWLVVLDTARQDIANLAKAKGPNPSEKAEIQGGVFIHFSSR